MPCQFRLTAILTSPKADGLLKSLLFAPSYSVLVPLVLWLRFKSHHGTRGIRTEQERTKGEQDQIKILRSYFP